MDRPADDPQSTQPESQPIDNGFPKAPAAAAIVSPTPPNTAQYVRIPHYPNQAAAALQQMQDDMRTQWAVYGEQVRYQDALYQTLLQEVGAVMPAIGFQVDYGDGIKIDIPAYTSYVSDLTKVYAEMLEHNGDLNAAEMIIAASPGMNIAEITHGPNGDSYKLVMQDQNGIFRYLGVTSQQFNTMHAILESSVLPGVDKSAGYIPRQLFEENKELFAAFPWMFERRRGANGQYMDEWITDAQGNKIEITIE